MHPFKNYLHRYVDNIDKDWEKIAHCLDYLEVSKKTILLREGEICKHLYFVERGLLHFYIIREGIEITRYFTEAPYLFTSQQSFVNKLPATENIRTIEDCYLWKMSYENAFKLLALESWSTFTRKLIQEVQYNTELIYTDTQTLTAEARYQRMLIESPELILRIPQKYIASYLGIAPQSLSRLKKKLFSDRKAI